MSISKEKRTKEQAMRLLDRAIEQEESLLEKVQMLESELAECRKKAENPRHELDEQAIPGSKVSFRLDYYRMEEKGPIKGIVEHLPTRESKSFEGERFDEIKDFIARFVGTSVWPPDVSTRPSGKKTSPALSPKVEEKAVVEEKKERSKLLQRLFPESFAPPAPELATPLEVKPTAVPVQLEAEPFLVLTEGKEENQRAMRKGEPIQIGIRMKQLDTFWGKPCCLSLSAKSLERKPAQALETREYFTPDQDLMCVPIRTFPLQQGVYRLVVSMTLRDEPQKAFYKEDRLLIVQ